MVFDSHLCSPSVIIIQQVLRCPWGYISVRIRFPNHMLPIYTGKLEADGVELLGSHLVFQVSDPGVVELGRGAQQCRLITQAGARKSQPYVSQSSPDRHALIIRGSDSGVARA